MRFFSREIQWWHMAGAALLVIVIIAALIALANPRPVVIPPIDQSLADECRTRECTIEEKLRAGDVQLCADIADRGEAINCATTIVREKALSAGESYCAYLPSPREKEQCLTEYYFSESLKRGEGSLCEKIIDGALREKCLSAFRREGEGEGATEKGEE